MNESQCFCSRSALANETAGFEEQDHANVNVPPPLIHAIAALTGVGFAALFPLTLTTEVLWIANTHDGDGLLRPKLSHELEDNLEVWMGLDLFYGSHQGLFGQFHHKDRLLMGVKLGL